MYKISKEQILELSKKYDREEDQWNSSLEQQLGNRFRSSKEVSKENLIEVLKWKFATNKHRLKRELNLIEELDDSTIRQLSRHAFDSLSDTSRINNLMEIRGVGLAVASTILTFYDPKNYGVFDIHIYDEIFGTTSRTRPVSQNPELYIKLLARLRRMADKHHLDVRVVEKALFKKNIDKS